MYKIIIEFIKKLKRSLDEKNYLINTNQCNMCGKPSFFNTCLKCEINEAYEGYEK
jgi:hypothetical protein